MDPGDVWRQLFQASAIAGIFLILSARDCVLQYATQFAKHLDNVYVQCYRAVTGRHNHVTRLRQRT
jgi:hypothetical protein